MLCSIQNFRVLLLGSHPCKQVPCSCGVDIVLQTCSNHSIPLSTVEGRISCREWWSWLCVWQYSIQHMGHHDATGIQGRGVSQGTRTQFHTAVFGVAASLVWFGGIVGYCVNRCTLNFQLVDDDFPQLLQYRLALSPQYRGTRSCPNVWKSHLRKLHQLVLHGTVAKYHRNNKFQQLVICQEKS